MSTIVTDGNKYKCNKYNDISYHNKLIEQHTNNHWDEPLPLSIRKGLPPSSRGGTQGFMGYEGVLHESYKNWC